MARPDRDDGLRGVTVGLLQARHGRELAALVGKRGGVAVHAPCMREIPAEDRDAMRVSVQRAVEGPLYMAIFLTGVGTAELFAAATDSGLYDALMSRLRPAIVVARGPKPLAVLHRHGLTVDRRTSEPHTTEQVRELVGESLEGRTVLLQHYGMDNAALSEHLRDAGADVVEVHPYAWAMPTDIGPVHALLDRLAAGGIDIMAFTSASQVHMLFQIADDEGREDQLREWLAVRTVVAAVGPVCAAALQDHGVTTAIQPERPKMVPLIDALCDYASSFGAATAKRDPS
ncbi:MAG: uroporphyrinogen-III synthase [Candidatus Dormibacteria bacterium]